MPAAVFVGFGGVRGGWEADGEGGVALGLEEIEGEEAGFDRVGVVGVTC